MNKEQYLKWGALIAGALVTIGVILYFIFSIGSKDTLDGSVSMGDILVLHGVDNSLSFYSEEGAATGGLSLEGDYVVANDNATAIYVLKTGVPNTVTKVWLEEDELKSKELYAFEKEISDSVEVKWGRDFGVLLDRASNEFTVIKPEFFELTSLNVEKGKEIEGWQVSDDSIYYAQDKVIYRLGFDGKVISKTSVEDTTIGLQFLNDKLVAVNEFGSGNGDKTILTLNAETLDIEDLTVIKANKITLLPTMAKNEMIFGLVDEEIYYGINPSNASKLTKLPKHLAEKETILFGNRFVYTTDKSKAEVYQTRNANSSFKVEGQFKSILPLFSVNSGSSLSTEIE